VVNILKNNDAPAEKKQEPQNILTIEKVADMRITLGQLLLKNKSKTVNINEYQKECENIGINNHEFIEYFKDFFKENKENLIKEEVEKHLAKLEKNLLEKCLGQAKIVENPSFQIDSKVFTSFSKSFSEMPIEGKDSKGLGIEDYSLEDYLNSIKEILIYLLSDGNYEKIQKEEIFKIIKEMTEYINISIKKSQKNKETLKNIQNSLENKETQEAFLQSKIKNYQDALDELQKTVEKNEKDQKILFELEDNYEKMKERNAELDKFYVENSGKITELQSKCEKFENSLKSSNSIIENLNKEINSLKLEKNELLISLDNLQAELTKKSQNLPILPVENPEISKIPEKIVENEHNSPKLENSPKIDLSPKRENIELKKNIAELQHKIMVNFFIN